MGKHLERAKFLINTSRHKDALNEIYSELSEEPENPESYVCLSISLTQLEQHNSAIDAAKQAISLSPDWDYAYFILSCALEGKENIDSAITEVENAIEISPEDDRYHMRLSYLYGKKQQFQQMLSSANECLRINSESVEGLINKGVALCGLNQKSEGKEYFINALSINPESKSSLVNVGVMLLEDKHTINEAKEYFYRALEIDPNYQIAHNNLKLAFIYQDPFYNFMLPYTRWRHSVPGSRHLLIFIILCSTSRLILELARNINSLYLLMLQIFCIFLIYDIVLHELIIRIPYYFKNPNEIDIISIRRGLFLCALISIPALWSITGDILFLQVSSIPFVYLFFKKNNI